MKKCIICKITKELKFFNKDKLSKDSFHRYCKQCNIIQNKKYRRTKYGLISNMYSHQKIKSKKRKHNPPSYTKQELKEWLFNQPLFHELYDKWELSNYDTDLVPSVDRLDDYIGYMMDNIQLTTWSENNLKHRNDRKNGINNKINKSVIQLTTDGKIVAEFFSISEAFRTTNINLGNIASCCRGDINYSHAGGFIWKFKEERN